MDEELAIVAIGLFGTGLMFVWYFYVNKLDRYYGV